MKYATLKDAVTWIQQLGPGCYLAKSDIKSAFRIVPLHPSQYPLMGFKWEGLYYYDKCLAMGLAESCRIFELVSDAILFILKHHFNLEKIVKVLDDFLFLGATQEECAATLHILPGMLTPGGAHSLGEDLKFAISDHHFLGHRAGHAGDGSQAAT